MTEFEERTAGYEAEGWDDGEARVLAMGDDLAASGEPLPESIRLMNEAAVRTVRRGGFGRSIIAEAIFAAKP